MQKFMRNLILNHDFCLEIFPLKFVSLLVLAIILDGDKALKFHRKHRIDNILYRNENIKKMYCFFLLLNRQGNAIAAPGFVQKNLDEICKATEQNCERYLYAG